MPANQLNQYAEAVESAKTFLRSPAANCPFLFTSNFADAFWITAFSLYHSGQAPRYLRRSKGHSWVADLPGHGMVRVAVTAADHREGISIIEYI